MATIASSIWVRIQFELTVLATLLGTLAITSRQDQSPFGSFGGVGMASGFLP